ncbi:MAG: hypothetical protein J7K62_03810 [Thermoplasmata archaeon]|nr:hypothetical protein [Thermoplasmata archaeon]
MSIRFKIFLSTSLLALLFLTSVTVSGVNWFGECKDIVAVGDATAGNYNLLLKVRDPSRPGLQTLCIVNKGYEYDYHSPSMFGRKMHFMVERKFIGVVTKGDTPPNIVKPGMAFSDAGIAYGDADSPIGWTRLNKNAWDDFDWIRYACQTAENEDKAVSLLTEDVVKKMHAPGVAENLFVVGPRKAFLIEADAYHYKVKEIKDVLVVSNYPKELWRNRPLRKLFISSSFDKNVERVVRKGSIVRLGSFFGVKIVDVNKDSITVKRFPFGEKTMLGEGEEKTVDYFRVKLIDSNGKTARISVCYKYYAWEQKMMNYILSKYGSIDVGDMMNWSRIHSDDLEGLRGMCEGGYEASMIYKIPDENYDIFSIGWFAPNQCSSIFVPIHVCVNNIYEPYQSGEAARISSELLKEYGHKTLTPVFKKVEDVFLNENEEVEEIVKDLIKNKTKLAEIFTISDTEMQKQAFISLSLWLDLAKMKNIYSSSKIASIWGKNYSTTLQNIRHVFDEIEDPLKEKVIELALSIGKSREKLSALIFGKNLSKYYNYAKSSFKNKDYEKGFEHLENILENWDQKVLGETKTNSVEKEREINYLILFTSISVGLLVLILFLVVIKRRLIS